MRRSLSGASDELNRLGSAMRGGLRHVFSSGMRTMDDMVMKIRRAPLLSFERAGRKLETLGAKTRLLDPVNVLRRGYSMTTIEGRTLRSVDEAEKGGRLRTVLFDGEITSIVDDINKEERDA